MAVLSSITSKLTLDTSKWSTRLQRARRRLRSFGKATARSARMVAGFGIAAGAAAVGGLALIVKQQLKAIDATGKFANSIGIQTEQLIGLRHAAALGGVETGKFDKSLQRMVRNIGDAVEGTGEAAGAIELLGLNAADLAAMSPDQALATIADGMLGIENETQKASVAYRLFGRDGISLLNVLNEGSEGLAKNQAEAERLGLTFDGVDHAKVAAANDAMTRLHARITGVAQTLTIELAPFVQAAAQELANMGMEGKSASDIIVGGMEFIVTGIAEVADWMELLKAGFFGARAGVTVLVQTWVKGVKLWADAINAVLDTKAARYMFGELSIPTDLIEAAIEDLGDSASEAWDSAGESMDRFIDGANSAKVREVFNNIRNNAQENAEAIAAAASEQRGAVVDFEALADEIEAQEQAALKVTSALADIQAELDGIGLTDIEIKLADLEELGATVEQLDEARNTLEEIGRIKREQERQEDITSILEDLQQDVRTFGLSQEEKRLLDLEALGASEAQIQKARDAIAELDQLNKGATGPDAQENSLVRAGSAEAQRAAFAASRAARDDVPRAQLTAQQGMHRALLNIERNTEQFDLSQFGTEDID